MSGPEAKTRDPIAPEDAANVAIMPIRVVKVKKVPEYTTRAIAAYTKRCIENKKYYCERCNKAFGDKTSLDTHLNTRIHTNAQPKPRKSYECQLCDFHTLIKTHLTVHNRTKKHQNAIEEAARIEAARLAAEMKTGEVATHIVPNPEIAHRTLPDRARSALATMIISVGAEPEV